MSTTPLVVIDTNVLVSAALSPHSVPAQAFRRVLERERFAICEQSMAELQDVLSRDKFDRFTSRQRRMALLDLVRVHGVAFTVEPHDFAAVGPACRDPDDALFLALALAAQAQTIVSGDDDLLTLHPWRGITICTPAQYLERAG